jgi:hypothetical protein
VQDFDGITVQDANNFAREGEGGFYGRSEEEDEK